MCLRSCGNNGRHYRCKRHDFCNRYNGYNGYYRHDGYYRHNGHCDDIDWQIECDFLGMMYPGFVNASAARSFDIGHITNYGDGVYGGVFVTAMHSAAFTASTVEEIVNAGLAVIPDNTTFKDAMNVVIESYRAGDTWEECWQKLETKYGTVDKCPEMSTKKYNIDAKLNAAYILVGLLWGGGDFEQTMIISGRCGQDSDCNPSSAASILGNTTIALTVSMLSEGGQSIIM